MDSLKILPRLAGAIRIVRFRGLLPVAACLGICVIALNFLLLWIAGAAPRAFALPEIYLEWSNFERAADIVSALVAAYTPGPAVARKPFLLYTGLSTALEGVDPRSLAANDGCDAPVIGICGTGGSMSDLLALQKALFRSNLRPSVAVVCIHSAWLAGMFPEFQPDSLNPIAPLRHADWREVRRRALWWNWIAQNRFYTNQAAFKILYAARVELGTVAAVDPWRVPERIGYTVHQTKAQVQAQMLYLAGLGWFDPQRYAHEQDAQSAALRQLIAGLRDRGAEVIVALMPESSAFRTRLPSEPKQYLLAYLRREFGHSAPPVFDFQNTIADDMFSDLLHMNDGGRAAFTIQLARAIRTSRSAMLTGSVGRGDVQP